MKASALTEVTAPGAEVTAPGAHFLGGPVEKYRPSKVSARLCRPGELHRTAAELSEPLHTLTSGCKPLLTFVGQSALQHIAADLSELCQTFASNYKPQRASANHSRP